MFCNLRRFHNYETEYVAPVAVFVVCIYFDGWRTTDTTRHTPDTAIATKARIMAMLSLRPSAMCP